jgi:hypothetical protein
MDVVFGFVELAWVGPEVLPDLALRQLAAASICASNTSRLVRAGDPPQQKAPGRVEKSTLFVYVPNL